MSTERSTSNILLPLRAVQILFAIILLGLTGYLANATNGSFRNFYYESPGQVSFNVFNSVWTILVGAALLVIPLKFAGSKANHHYGALALDALTMIFWFAGFIALAVWTNRTFNFGGFEVRGRVYNVAVAASVFAAFEWLLFVATTALSALHSNRARGSITKSNTAATPAANV